MSRRSLPARDDTQRRTRGLVSDEPRPAMRAALGVLSALRTSAPALSAAPLYAAVRYAAVLSSALLVLGSSSVAHAWCQMTSSTTAPTALNPCVTDGIPLTWHRSCVEYSIDKRGTSTIPMSQLQAAVAASFNTWQTVSCGGSPTGFSVIETAQHSACLESEFNQGGPNVNTIAFVKDWAKLGYDPNAFAITTVWHSTVTGEILDADMQLNEQLGPFAICADAGCPTGPANSPSAYVDLQNVVTHEAGHFFGLAHSTIIDSTMYAYSTRGETTRRTLASDDIQGICTMYPPGKLPKTCNYTPLGGLKLECGADATCSISHGAPQGAPAWLVLLGLAVALAYTRRRR